MFKKKPNGIFNLDYEETVLAISRIKKLRERLKKIYELAIRLLRFGRFSEIEKGQLTEIVKEAGTKEEW